MSEQTVKRGAIEQGANTCLSKRSDDNLKNATTLVAEKLESLYHFVLIVP
jgi:hypothetical protein